MNPYTQMVRDDLISLVRDTANEAMEGVALRGLVGRPEHIKAWRVRIAEAQAHAIEQAHGPEAAHEFLTRRLAFIEAAKGCHACGYPSGGEEVCIRCFSPIDAPSDYDTDSEGDEL